MEEKYLKTLEYNKIINILKDFAGSEIGIKMCEDLSPISDYSTLKSELKLTDDAFKRINKNGAPDFSGVADLNPIIGRLKIGSFLNTSELIAISKLLASAKRAKSYGNLNKDEDFKDDLTALFEAIEPLTYLARDIDSCIISEDEIADDASANLKSIRRQMKITTDRIHTTLTSFVASKAGRTYLQDGIITMRDGRYCVPVKAEHKSDVGGIVHDQSSTGSTIFIEPNSIVELNNKMRTLYAKEADEIQIILANLSASCAEYMDQILQDLNIISQLDFIFAKAGYARSIKATVPIINTNHQIKIKQARHPLLDPKKVVPIDVNLGYDFSLLIVTGPNTGGKTVSLKTVGLLTLMAMSGLMIPADEGSTIGFFDSVYADIGDEQSIEQNLSTFSSHMVNIVHILDKADSNSLILFDELGAGTDPVEGAALAISILTFLKNMGCKIMASTHYSELKLFALSTDNVSNASCEFDVTTLKPTYRLLIGVPGKSNAFAISSKLGLSDYIINDAKSKIKSEDIKFEDVLSELERSRIQIEKDKETIKVYKSQIKSLKADYEKKTERLNEQKEKILTKARDEALEILKDAKQTADEAIRNINKHSKGGNNKELEKSRSNLGAKIGKNQSKSRIVRKTNTKTYKKSDFTIGTKVKVLSMNLEGTVLTPPNDAGNLSVKMGIFNSNVNIKDLEIIPENDIKAPGLTKTGSGKIRMSKALSVKTEINVIGKNVDEAINAIDKYLDDAYLANLSIVYIIHGKGTGTLRNAIQSHLKNLSYVKSFRTADPSDGGYGTTVVEFK